MRTQRWLAATLLGLLGCSSAHAPADGGADSSTPADGGADSSTPADGGADSSTPADGGTGPCQPDAGDNDASPGDGGVECLSDRECPDGSVCSPIGGAWSCRPDAPPACDDPFEPNDSRDRVTTLHFEGDRATIAGAYICRGDVDLYEVTVANGDSLQLVTDRAPLENVDDSISWAGWRFQQAEFLPAGTYTFAVRHLTIDSVWQPEGGYDFALVRTPGACVDETSCGPHRGACNAQGACERILGDGRLEFGDTCDSPDDCCEQYECSAPRVRDPKFCTPACETDADCSEHAEGASCVEFPSFSGGFYRCDRP